MGQGHAADSGGGRRSKAGGTPPRPRAEWGISEHEMRTFTRLFEDIAVGPPQNAVLRQHWDTWVEEDKGKHNRRQNRQVWDDDAVARFSGSLSFVCLFFGLRILPVNSLSLREVISSFSVMFCVPFGGTLVFLSDDLHPS